MKRNINLLLTLTFIFFLSCNKSEIKSELNQSITIVEPNYPESLFPAAVQQVEQAHIITQIHDGLLAWNIENEKPVGRLVDRWVMNNNKDKITFHLHPDIYFHQDPCFKHDKERLLTSSDVKYSIEYTFWYKAKHSKGMGLLKYIIGGEEFFNSCNKELFEPGKLEGINIIDSLSFDIHLIEPNESFLKSLIANDMAILPPEGLQKYGENCTVGCGPFVLKNNDKQNKVIELARNENYYLKDNQSHNLPYLDKITFLYEAVPAKSLRMLRDQKADLLLSMDQKHIKAFVEDNIELFEKKFPDLVLLQAKGLEESSVYYIKRGNIKNFKYSSLNILYLENVRLKNKKSE
jgi:peptide/nickel transport system substrate-binding protein